MSYDTSVGNDFRVTYAYDEVSGLLTGCLTAAI